MDKTEKAYQAAKNITDNNTEMKPITGDSVICDLCQREFNDLSEEQKELFLEAHTGNESYTMPVVCYMATIMRKPSYGVVWCGFKAKR